MTDVMALPVCDCVGRTHEHGDGQMYNVHRCRCDECRATNTRRQYLSRKRKIIGQLTLVDAEPARQHVLMLRRSGLTLRDVARRADVSDRMLHGLTQGYLHRNLPPSERIDREAAQRLLAIPKPRTSKEASAWRRMSTLGTIRRIQALATMGWSVRAISRESGLHHGTLYKVMARDTTRISLAQDVADAYRRLSQLSPPDGTPHERKSITETKRLAERNGWKSPMHWDTRTIDLPPGRAPGTGAYAGEEKEAS